MYTGLLSRKDFIMWTFRQSINLYLAQKYSTVSNNAAHITILIILTRENVSNLSELRPFLETVIRAQFKHDEENGWHVI